MPQDTQDPGLVWETFEITMTTPTQEASDSYAANETNRIYHTDLFETELYELIAKYNKHSRTGITITAKNSEGQPIGKIYG